jgi:hypothetical protein
MTELKKRAGFCGMLFVLLLAVGWLQAGRVQVLAQAAAPEPAVVKDFAGTWNWMFEDKRFATMTLKQDGDQLTGSMTNGHIDLDERGRIASAIAVTGTTPIVKTTLEGGRLILLARDGDDETEFAMTLTSSSTAELRFYGDGAPQSAQPIRLEKVWSEPPVAP